MRTRVIVVAWVLSAGCADAHPAPVRCRDGMCPTGQVCLPSEGEVCVAMCEFGSLARCTNGAACRLWGGRGVCWPGRTIREGEATLGPNECVFGLREAPDYDAEPFRFTCEPACNENADCRAGEVCYASTCSAPCRNPAGEPCAGGSHCVDRVVCVNERRFSRIDCDNDGDHDCTLGLMCDPEDPSMCTYVPMGEE